MDSLRALLSLCSAPLCSAPLCSALLSRITLCSAPQQAAGYHCRALLSLLLLSANYHLFPCLSLSLSLHKHRTTGGRDSARQELPERLPACVPATATASAMPCSALGSPMSHKLTRPPAHTAIINSSIVILFSLTLSLPLRQDLNR